MSTTVWGGRLRKRFCNMFSEISTGSWAELRLSCCPSKQGELPENMSQSLLLNLPPHPVHLFVFQDRLTIDCLNGWSLATGSLVWGFRSQNKMPKILL